MGNSRARAALLGTTVLVGAMLGAGPAMAQADPGDQQPSAEAQDPDVAEPVLGDDQQVGMEARTGAGAAGSEIIVTGSRIPRPNMEANSPITVVEGERLVANADVTLETFLNTLPQANPAGTTTSNNPGNAGQANINLRGLGPNRNLVLVDGRRPMVSAQNMTVDLNTIPAALIERIDVITGGAGAAYGADAIAGVVNVILRSKFEGFDIRATYADTADRDAREFNASAVLGGNFADGRGNAVIGFDYTDRESLIKAQRPFAAFATQTTTFLPEGWYSAGGNAPSQAAVDTVFGRYGAAPGSVVATSSGLSFNLDGTLFSPGVFASGLDVVNFKYPIDLSVNQNLFPDLYSYNFDEVNLLVLPLKRRSIMGKMSFEVSDLFQPFAQFGWTRYSSTTALAPTPVPTVGFRNPNDPARTGSDVSTGLVEPGRIVSNFLIVPLTNPFIPQDMLEILASRTGDDPNIVGSGATEPFLLRQRTLSAGLRTNNFTNEVIQYLGGARGNITDNWRYEAYYSEGRTEIVNRGKGAIDTQKLQAMLEAPDGGASLCEGGFNPFGRQPLSADCAAYLEVETRNSVEFKQRIGQAFLSGDVAELPGGTVGLVVGAEIRKFEFENDPGALSGPISGPNVVNPVAGENSFRDVFAELRMPILSGRQWAEELELGLGWRRSHWESTNNLTGAEAKPSTDDTYKAELSYAPVRPLRLRASFQRAVRAPNFGELFAGGGSAPQFFDPCSVTSEFRQGRRGLSAAEATTFCSRAHAGANPIPESSFASYVQPPGSQLTVILEGNPEVRPEKAKTFTLGAVFNTPAASGVLSTLRGSLDYYNMQIDDGILAPDPNIVNAACFNYLGTNPDFDPTNPNCKSLLRSGPLLFRVTNPQSSNGTFQVNNNAQARTSGIDAQLSWTLPMEWVGAPGAGRLNFDLLLNHLLEFKVREALPGLPFVDYAGTVSYFGQGLGTSFPRWRGQLSTTYDKGPVSLNLRTRYIHSMKNRASQQYVGETDFSGTGAVWYFDTSATLKVDKMMFRIGVNNLFDRQPPVYTPNVQSGTDPSLYDVIGRRFFATVGLRY